VAEVFEEGQDPHRAVVPVIMMICKWSDSV
jgi:hypothetical protein